MVLSTKALRQDNDYLIQFSATVHHNEAVQWTMFVAFEINSKVKKKLIVVIDDRYLCFQLEGNKHLLV